MGQRVRLLHGNAKADPPEFLVCVGTVGDEELEFVRRVVRTARVEEVLGQQAGFDGAGAGKVFAFGQPDERELDVCGAHGHNPSGRLGQIEALWAACG